MPASSGCPFGYAQGQATRTGAFRVARARMNFYSPPFGELADGVTDEIMDRVRY